MWGEKMCKKIIVTAGIACLSILVSLNSAFAISGFEEIFTTDSFESHTPKVNFGWNETPWLYLNLPSADFNASASFWNDPEGESFLVSAFSNDDEYWLSLDNGWDSSGAPVNWSEVRRMGQWNVYASFLYATGGSGTGATNFTVTPEPISSILFLIGGAALATRRYYKTRRIQKA